MRAPCFPLTDPAFHERYQPGPLLGAGGMARVYRAVHRSLDRPVAIKLLVDRLSAFGDGPERFLAEARMAAGLLHPNVVLVFDYGIADGIPYLVTELVEGRSLAELLRERLALSVAEVFAIARHVLAGLDAIHRGGIIHRDLKPENILLAAGDPWTAKIADFGIAKQAGGAASPDTVSGVILGTPAYMAPEQVASDPLSPATDLYALALVLHRMITGRHAFLAPTTMELLHSQLLEDPELPEDLHPAVAGLLARGLRKRPEHRFTSAREMAAELEVCACELDGAGSFYMQEPASLRAVSFVSRGDTLAEHATHATRVTPHPGWLRVTRRALAGSLFALALAIAIPFAHAALLKRPAVDEHGWPIVRESEAEAAPRPPATLETVRSSARELKVEDAARALFEVTRAHPELAGLRLVSHVPHLDIAQNVDRAILDVMEAALLRPEPRGPGPRALPLPEVFGGRRANGHGMASCPTAGDAFVLELAGYLRAQRWRDADLLVHAFARLKRPAFAADTMGVPAGSPDALSLHPANAFTLVAALAAARGAGSLSELILAMRLMEVCAVAHPDHPIGDAARELLSGFLARCGPPGLMGPAFGVRRTGALAAWPRLAALAQAVRRHLESRWVGSSGIAPADLRRALLISDVINHLNQRDWRGMGDTGPYGSVMHISTFFEYNDPRGVWLSDEVDDQDDFFIDSPLPRALVLELARGLSVGAAPLIAQVEKDAVQDPPRKTRTTPRAARPRPFRGPDFDPDEHHVH